SQDMDTMRSAVFPGVIKSIITKYRRGFKHQKLFEIANVHEVDSSNILPKEKCKVCFAVLGSYFKSNWIGKVEADNFYYLKGVAEQVLKLFTDNYDFVRSNEKFFHTGKSADILVNGVKIGYIGELHPEYYDYLDIDEKLYIAEIDLSLLMEKGDKGLPQYRKISQYPYVYKDISLIVDRNTEAKLIYNSIKVFSDLIKDVELFDIYSGEKIGEDKISMTFRIYFNDLNKTLTDEETNKIVGSIIDDLSKRYGATLR
ncbi:MAG: phenylalanine--tRNA ligase subunit beta, partial [Deferribacterales bacterium]